MGEEEIKMMFKLMEYDYLTEMQHNLIISFEEQFKKRGYLTERQETILKNIFESAANRVQWSRK